MTDKSLIEKVKTKQNWYHQITLPDGSVTPGTHNSDEVRSHLDKLGLPKDASGLRVLDIGCRDGYFSFEMEKRGATDVVGIDYESPENTGFGLVSQILGSKVAYVVENVYDLTPEKHGTFDIVLFLGVLYHLRNPMLAIDSIRSVTKPGGLIFAESHVIDNYMLMPDGSTKQLGKIAPALKSVPIIPFYPRATLAGDATNKTGPNLAAFQAMMEEGQFQTRETWIYGTRGYVVGEAVEDAALEFYRAKDSGINSGSSNQGS